MTSDRAPRAVVVGGGIGGLAAARGLQLAGWSVLVLERAAALEPLGAGISLWPNAVRALQDLGVHLPVRTDDTATGGGMRTRHGRWMARTHAERFPDRYGAPLLAVHRADLQEALLGALAPGTVVTGTPVLGIDGGPDSARVRHGAGEERAELVVIADGVRSAARALVAGPGPRPRYAGYTAWRAVVPAGAVRARLDGATESWGRGERFGIVPLADGRVYWFATANAPEGEHAVGGEHAEVRRRFSDWHAPIPEVVRATCAGDVLRHDVYELRPHPRSYVGGRLVLLGDAAHAMSPDLGQGACQAIEDAAALRVLVPVGGDVDAGLAAYDRLRRPRARGIARRSAQVGRLGQLEGRVTSGARDLAVRWLPDVVGERQLDGVLRWRPPPAVVPGGAGSRG
ncbi:2-polyprenyl-6-methoxyphenol hydroxylase [Blastococcus aurantiacus]|uniref:2-polyprenyl-6-methoxyphenol hydroxylase n=1 Tax=Blastococcus aurantiacus TaxID=1550231 RepID=A0A1G7NI44_9ACTN|nr:FAD-dependent monooxygenase [Blastococcus aurantiacus]SDF73744.1 2-polyprenyl-6-methoxyphenol hydroxylase [Blastococcus aurantiacus]